MLKLILTPISPSLVSFCITLLRSHSWAKLSNFYFTAQDFWKKRGRGVQLKGVYFYNCEVGIKRLTQRQDEDKSASLLLLFPGFSYQKVLHSLKVPTLRVSMMELEVHFAIFNFPINFVTSFKPINRVPVPVSTTNNV